MTYRPDESFPEGVTVREIVMTLLGMALVAVFYLMLTAPSDDRAEISDRSQSEPVIVEVDG